MLAYAADRRPAGASASPRSLILIVAAHAVALAAVMSAKMEVIRFHPDPTDVTLIPNDPVPPPPPPDQVEAKPNDQVRSTVTTVPPLKPIPSADPIPFDPGPVTPPDLGNGSAVVPQPTTPPQPPLPIARTAARFATPEGMVRPPYPEAKRRLAEEASLRLSLQIDPRGRVVAVDPVGPADPAFLDAARKHILRHWRYKPATEGGSAVASTITVTLQFKLDEE